MDRKVFLNRYCTYTQTVVRKLKIATMKLDSNRILTVLNNYISFKYSDEDLISSLDSITVMITEFELMHIRKYIEQKNAEIERIICLKDKQDRRELILEKVQEIKLFINETNISR